MIKCAPIMTAITPDDARKFCSLKIHHNVFGDLTIASKRYKDASFNSYITELYNSCDKVLGYENFRLSTPSSHIDGMYLNVAPEYRQKFKFGELLRLVSIINMFENNINSINITSKDTAIYFHSRYKFEPSLMQFSQRDKALESILQNPQKGFENFHKKAKEILDNILKHSDNAVYQRALRGDANSLIGEYIRKVLSDGTYNSHPIQSTLDMSLHRDSIIDNADYFNKLFEKHGIDYQI